MTDRTTTAIRFPDELHQRLRAAAEERGLSINYLVVKGVEEVLDHLIALESFRLTVPSPPPVVEAGVTDRNGAEIEQSRGEVIREMVDFPSSFGDVDHGRVPVSDLTEWVLHMAKEHADETYVNGFAQARFGTTADRDLAMGLWCKAREAIERREGEK